MLDDPPSALPRSTSAALPVPACTVEAPSQRDDGSNPRNPQGDAIASVASRAPASSNNTRTPGRSESREAITHPAVPAPTTT